MPPSRTPSSRTSSAEPPFFGLAGLLFFERAETPFFERAEQAASRHRAVVEALRLQWLGHEGRLAAGKAPVGAAISAQSASTNDACSVRGLSMRCYIGRRSVRLTGKNPQRYVIESPRSLMRRIQIGVMALSMTSILGGSSVVVVWNRKIEPDGFL